MDLIRSTSLVIRKLPGLSVYLKPPAGVRNAIHSRTGAYLEEPKTVPFGLIGIVGTVLPGLFLGAFISKTLASFLEENELFVPSDDDDDDL